LFGSFGIELILGICITGDDCCVADELSLTLTTLVVDDGDDEFARINTSAS